MKLLAKTAEERYRSAGGLAADLRRCLKAVRTLGRVQAFSLGSEDPIERLEIPERLYGREQEVAQLMAAFQRVGVGGAELLLVSGYAGIGKTSLVLEVQKPVAGAKGYFAAGKYDQLNRDEPYSALIRALTDLVRQLLAEDDRAIAAWRRRFTQALGANARVILDVVPDLELIIGPQAAVLELGPMENRNRLELQFQRFIAALARRGHPLVLFLDDLQWADSASLGLMTALLGGTGAESFLLIGAYRDNEVDARHPLMSAIEEIRRAGEAVSDCPLGPLSKEQVEAMLADGFGCATERVRPLAHLAHEKTLGNPFFARTFLSSAFDHGLIRYGQAEGWAWETAEIRRVQPTDNVVDLLSTRIERLRADSRAVLELASCIGNRFDLATLVTVCDLDVDSIRAALLPPLREGLIETKRADVYAFRHDRVQEAAYRRIDPAERARLHQRIGALLMAQFPSEDFGERLFEITDHLNQARPLLRTRDERHRLARLNLQAGGRARRSAAFNSALTYFDNGIRSLGRRLWSDAYELAYPLYLGRAECAYLCGQLEAAEKDIGRLLKRSGGAQERARAYLLRMIQYENTARFPAAVRAGKAALALFGIRFPKDTETTQAAIDEAMKRIRRRIGHRPVGGLADLPRMQDSETRMVMRLLMTLWAPAYISGDKPLTVLIAARMVELSLEHGNTEESAYGYVTHAITLGAILRDYAAAYEFGRLALAVNHRFDDLRARAKVNHMFSCYIGFWRRPIAESFPYSRAAYSAGLESGDFVYAAYGCFHESWHALFSGWELERFQQHYGEKLGFLERVRNRSFYDAHQLMLHWGLSLQGRTRELGGLSDEQFDESTYLERYRQVDFFTAFHHIAKLSLLYTFGDYAGARAMARRSQRVSLGVRGMIWDAWLCFYHALTLTASGQDSRTGLTKAERCKLDELTDRMGLWARNGPQNFAHQHRLLQAERARIDGRPADAIEHYEAAVSGATEAGFIQHQALAKERYAEFWLARGTTRLARLYLTDALADYARWGATAKVRRLAERHPDLVREAARLCLPETKPGAPEHDPLDTSTLIAATHALSGEVDSERLVDILLRLLVQSAGAQRAMLFSLEAGALDAVAEAAVDSGGLSVHPAAGADWRARAAGKAVNYVRHTRRTLVVDEALRDAHLASDPYVISSRAKSILCAPMLHQSTLEGIVYLDNDLVTAAFTPARLSMVEALAAQAAISLKNARLFREVRGEAGRRHKAEKRLSAVAAGTAGAVGDGFFRELVLHLSQAMEVRMAFVTECADAARTRVRTLAFVDQGQFVDELEYELEGTPCRDVIGGDTCFYPAGLEERFPKEKGLESYLGVPMHGADREVLGHLAVLDDEPLEQSPDNESLLRIFATRAGAELERQRAQADYERAQAVLAERQRLASIGEFATMIAHEIRSPLSTIGMALDYLHKEALSEKALKRLNLARGEKDRLQALLSEILLFAKPQQLATAILDPGELIRETIENGLEGPEQDRRRIEYEGPTEPVFVTADRDKLRQAIINLLSNACQAIAVEETVQASLTADPAGRYVRIQVSNPGQIPEEILKKLTEPFFTTKSRGTGLGLAIVKRILDAHDGQLEIRSDPVRGICVAVTLPTAGQPHRSPET
ncbi:MAG: AAA family ATPase [Pseudomonadota bacterium]|nr:AAA family ATPase [Pseudomonadota bacterium]